MSTTDVCGSPVLQQFCKFFRETKLVKLHLQPRDPMHEGYLIQVGDNPETPYELEFIESLVFEKNGHFASREKIQKILSRRYYQFDLEMFEGCIKEFLKIEEGIKDGSLVTQPPPQGGF